MKFFAYLLLTCALAASTAAQKSESDRKSNVPVEPFHVLGDVYYVGANEVTSFLIVTPKGHILIDSGFAETAPQIAANIGKLGFDVKDVKILLNTQAHYDHAGGFAALKRLSGAELMSSEADKPLLERGGKDDFAFGDTGAYDPVKVDKVFADGGKITLGGVSLTPIIMAGHTKGATAYLLKTWDSERKYDVLFFSSVTTPGYALLGNPKYPNLISDLRNTFLRLKKFSPDVFLASHGSFFDLDGKAQRRRTGVSPNPFVNKNEFRQFLAEAEKAFETKLVEQQKLSPVKVTKE